MRHIGTVVVRAGHARLALSRSLTDRGLEHALLGRGTAAQRWRTERWDSLRLLTPNWRTRLPGYVYEGDDPDGYMTAVRHRPPPPAPASLRPHRRRQARRRVPLRPHIASRYVRHRPAG